MAGPLWILLVASCNSESTPATTTPGSGTAAAKPTGSGGGFSADLAKEFAVANGSGSSAGSAEAVAGSAEVKTGSGDVGSAAMKAGSEGSAKSGSGEGSAMAKAGSGEGSAVAKAGSGEGSAKVVPVAPVDPGSGAKPPVRMTAELAAIKISLLPNWERDTQEAGTISLGVKVPGRPTSTVFVFRYGFEDASAPMDRDAYKKWLAEKRLLSVRQDRQAGAAWFLEGTDGSGSPAFRVVVNWGGRKLICHGSLYKDGESSKLGDLRDQTIIQAKQICETVAL